jgi:hypothetical protein
MFSKDIMIGMINQVAAIQGVANHIRREEYTWVPGKLITPPL